MISNPNIVNPSQSYSAIAQCGPTKDQAIVIEAHDGIPIKDYTFAIGKLTDPANIRFVSRISNNKKIAELLSTHLTVEINNVKLELRPL